MKYFAVSSYFCCSVLRRKRSLCARSVAAFQGPPIQLASWGEAPLPAQERDACPQPQHRVRALPPVRWGRWRGWRPPALLPGLLGPAPPAGRELRAVRLLPRAAGGPVTLPGDCHTPRGLQAGAAGQGTAAAVPKETCEQPPLLYFCLSPSPRPFQQG